MIWRLVLTAIEWFVTGIEMGCLLLLLLAGVLLAPAFALGALAYVGVTNAEKLAEKVARRRARAAA